MSIWLCSTSIRRGRHFLLGDLDCDHIAFNQPLFKTLLSAKPNGLSIKFLIEVTKKSDRLSAGETLVIVLVGHGKDDHSFTVGGDGRQKTIPLLILNTLGTCKVDLAQPLYDN
jgi:hypothetical protein